MPVLTESLQGNGGTSSVMAGMAAVAKDPDMLTDMFLTKEKNDAGIIGLKYYIRGKPWVVSIDDQLLFT